MGNKIIVEFDRKQLEEMCGEYDKCKLCKREIERIMWCNLCFPFTVEFKIKEQSNGNK